METIGQALKNARLAKKMSVMEVSRITKIPAVTIEYIEDDRFDELPGEVFVRGFLRSYGLALGLLPAEVIARYTANRRSAQVQPLLVPHTFRMNREEGRRFGVAIACVLLFILFTVAVSIILKPRGHDRPLELSLQKSNAPWLDEISLAFARRVTMQGGREVFSPSSS